MSLTRRRRMAAAAVAILLVPWWAAPLPVGALQVYVAEHAVPEDLLFPGGGGSVYTNISLARDAHVRDAFLYLRGGTVPAVATHGLNAGSLANGTANGWWGTTGAPLPAGPVEAYLVAPFNGSQVAGTTAMDGVAATAPSNPGNYTFEIFVLQVSTANLLWLNFTWAGFAFGGVGPSYSGTAFLYNFTDQEWEEGASYPTAQVGVQTLTWSKPSPANYVAAGGSVVVLVVAQTPDTELNTDFIEVQSVSGVFPRPAVDVGNDGSYEWRFDAPGWGSLGHLTEFEDGSRQADITFPDGGGNFSTAFFVRGDAQLATLRMLALPAANSTNASGANRTVAGGGSTGLGVSGLANNSVGTTGFVTLRNVTTLNATTVENPGTQGGELISGSDPNGYRKAAQTFNVTAGAPLSAISFYVSQFQGNPGPLVLTIETLNLTGMPSGIVRAAQTLQQSEIGANMWVTFGALNYTPPFAENLVAVLSMPSAPPDTATNYVTFGASLLNAFPDGNGLSYINLTGVGDTWVKPADTDLLFRIGQDVPASSSDAQNIRVDNTSGAYSQFGNISNISFAVDAPLITGGAHTFTVANTNPESIRFNWSLRLDYSRLAERLEVSIENTTYTVVQNNLSTGVELGLAVPIHELLLQVPPNVCVGLCPPDPEPRIRAVLNISSNTQGRVLLTDLDIRHPTEALVTGLGPAFDTYLWNAPAAGPRVDVPVRIYSPGPSTVSINQVGILYDDAPVFYGFFFNQSDEDVPLVFDLNTVFHDDWDNGNLSFTFTTPDGTANASVALVGRYNLSITPLPDRSGTITVNVTARDNAGLRNSSGPVVFTFVPVNDAPRLSVGQLNVTWGSVQEVDLTPFITDPDNPVSQTSVTAASGGSVSFSGRSLIFNIAPAAPDFPLNLTLSDGAAAANYTVLVHPRASDTPPSIAQPPAVEFPWDGAYRIDLGQYASDKEDNLSALTFDLNLTAGDPADLLWTVETDGSHVYLKLIPRPSSPGNFSGTLTVTDADGNTNSTTLDVRVVAPPNRPPRIVGLPPALELGDAPSQLQLATKWSDAEDQSPGAVSWEAVGDAPSLFTVGYDPTTQVLTVTPVAGASGTGTILITLRDSGGLTDTTSVAVSVNAPAGGGLSTGDAALMLALVFAAVVLLAAVAVRRDRSRSAGPARRKKAPRPSDELGSLSAETPEAEEGEEGASEVGKFLRGLTDEPAAAAAAAPEADPEPSPAAAARVGELYVVGLKDGAVLFQEPARNLVALSQSDENRLLQWAFDAAREDLGRAGDARVLEWDGQSVLLARGEHFFVAGRVEGEDPESVLALARPLIVEVDHEFPGTPHDWQRADLTDTVTDILRRLVK